MRYLDVDLAALIGEPVVIRNDPRDLTEMRVSTTGRSLTGVGIGKSSLMPRRRKNLHTFRTVSAESTTMTSTLIPSRVLPKKWLSECEQDPRSMHISRAASSTST